MGRQIMSNVERIFSVVCDVITSLKDVEADQLSLETRIDSLDMDSLDFVELQVVVKKNFAVHIDPEKFISGEIEYLSDLCRFIDVSAGHISE